MQVKNIVYEGKKYWVLKIKYGYEVYRLGVTHSTRCTQIGYTGEIGLNKAIKDCNKRDNEISKTKKGPLHERAFSKY